MPEDPIRAIFLNCTLKPSPATSHTQALGDKVLDIMASHGVEHESIRIVDHDVRFGVTNDEGDGDQWPMILERIMAADIIVVGTPIWFGVRSSVCQMIIERLDGTYTDTNEVGQYPLYNKVGGVVVTGNEDGAHAAAETTLFNLTHLGCTIAPNSDCYWVGDAGPGPSYLEAGGPEHEYTNRTATWSAHNMLHMARILRANPIPAEGNTREDEDYLAHIG